NKAADSEDFDRQVVRLASKVYLQVLTARQELRSIRHVLTVLMKRQTKINRRLQREKKKVHEEVKNNAKRLVAALERLVDTLSTRTMNGISM
ncbi:MAG TPA: hypothetical protein VGO47_03390, partial [Chlamydiales bacterium]|nr:hypothetical protein [Chlamydiales bacterium]